MDAEAAVLWSEAIIAVIPSLLALCDAFERFALIQSVRKPYDSTCGESHKNPRVCERYALSDRFQATSEIWRRESLLFRHLPFQSISRRALCARSTTASRPVGGIPLRRVGGKTENWVAEDRDGRGGNMDGAPEKIRTSGLQLRRLPLYPAELRAHSLSLAWRGPHRIPALPSSHLRA
jgi:hypothetical protein